VIDKLLTEDLDILRVLYERTTNSKRADASLTIPRINELLKNTLPHSVSRMILDQLILKGYVISPKRGVRDRYEITMEGIRYFGNMMEESSSVEGGKVDSATWTGSVEYVQIEGRAWLNIKNAIFDLKARVEITNFRNEDDRRDIEGLANALVAISEMAEPDLTLIDRITSHPKFRIYGALFVFVETIRGALGA
jgi:predicted transcriptional regulator